MNNNDSLQWLVDKAQIEHVGMLYGRANDDRDEAQPLWADCLAEDVVVEYPFGSWQGLETHRKIHRAGILNVFRKTQHALTNAIIDVSGGAATAEYLVHTAHVLLADDTDRIIFGGSIYRQNLVRTAEGWRIDRHQCFEPWIDDQGGLLSAVSSSVAEALKNLGIR